MAVILALETATTNCSVAVVDSKGEVLVKEDYGSKYSHGEKLHVYIDEILKEAGLTQNDLEAVAVSAGPGSYTGLRIGVSAAKGLCFALDIPLITIGTLDSLVRQLYADQGYLVAMLDARRMEAYTAVYDHTYKVFSPMQPQLLNSDSFSEFLKRGPVVFIGTANEKFSEICTHENARFVNGKLPSAKELIALAQAKFEAGDFADLAYFEPDYLKAFQPG
ncbi:tRNA (adenosine(37)-N6)-threonylcarbamoyltransferase complex dimerization subunit type 1 TsaB [Gilvibacter sediminis]|uniref:tRNA (adenosine(37)-N6)-threonylcarbamoyltransferase complex dimerization subunit type 1 TsaB n=1 Tax=Gilvibacter sediminis TaxID=379071 RepID=UPI002350373A|nr:tRNA (adenosine(37)-N6)-threonylcarbamoyltransferase complex dimerization subunit type 1 TsaB [Gilvibacter sediminis]MDC7996392.1 tRNA (adenosine(37)-N6)-threonylcarbamoyltransferase complex dimerization subunit type 1 TsaB [Gilvibacter sediminis]